MKIKGVRFDVQCKVEEIKVSLQRHPIREKKTSRMMENDNKISCVVINSERRQNDYIDLFAKEDEKVITNTCSQRN